MPTKVRDVIDLMEIIAPPWMAIKGDPIGLHTGNPDTRIKNIMVALDASHAAVKEAKQKRCQMLVVHHPRFYHPLKNLDESTSMGARAAEIVRAKLAVYCAHTNLDVAPGGVNDTLADLVGLIKIQPISQDINDPMLKLVVFVPDSHLQTVRNEICTAGGGIIGEYCDCSYRSQGIGSFRGSDISKPYLGNSGQFEEVEEWRLEILLTKSIRPQIESALRRTHPYEEPAFDIYLLANNTHYGLGRIGQLKRPVSLKTLARRLKKDTKAPGTLVLGEQNRKVSRIAVWSGSGCPVKTVIANQAETLVTGEIGYHDTEILNDAGVSCIMLGHGPCEDIILPGLAENLRQGLADITVHEYREAVPPMWSV